MKKMLMLLTVFAVAMPVMAATGYANGYTWTYRISGGTVEIEGISPEPTGTVTIPSTLGGKPVTSIGESAFEECSGLTSVMIPDSVTSIGRAAFAECSLNSVTIPASVKHIGTGAFYCETLKSLVLPLWCKNAKEWFNSDGWSVGIAETGRILENSLAWHMSYCCCIDVDPRRCEADFKRQVKITFKDVWNGGGSGGGSNGGAVAEMWKKAQTLQAVLRNNYSGDVKGVIQVKVGKANKNGQVSISGTITGLDGKKKSAKGGKVTVSGSSATTTLAVKDGTTSTVTVDAYGVSGSWNGCRIVRATIGGEVWKKAYFNIEDAPGYFEVGGHEYAVGSESWGWWPDLSWPYYEPVEMRGRKWYCEKAARVAWGTASAQFAPGIICENCDEDNFYSGWIPLGYTNYNGLKLSYNMNTGVFKGSFNLYMTEHRNGNDKGVKKKVNVSGVLADGVGYGIATLRSFGSWAVTVE